MSQTDLVYELLKSDLCASRVILPQVTNYIQDYYGFADSELDRFFAEKYPTLEDYEVDLTFSPQYTPAQHNRLEYIPVLGARALEAAEVDALKQRLKEGGFQTALRLPENNQEFSLPLHEVFIDRYVNLLKLELKLPAGIHDAIVANVPEESRNLVNLLARDEVWQAENRQVILIGFLKVFKARNTFGTPKLSFLTNFVRTYRPAGIQDYDRQLEALIKSCEADMENVSGRGFHDEYLRALHGAERLNKGEEADVWEHYKHMMEMARLLREDLQHLPEAAPEVFEQARQPV